MCVYMVYVLNVIYVIYVTFFPSQFNVWRHINCLSDKLRFNQLCELPVISCLAGNCFTF